MAYSPVDSSRRHIGQKQVPVSGTGNKSLLSGARKHDALSQQMIPAEKNKDELRFYRNLFFSVLFCKLKILSSLHFIF